MGLLKLRLSILELAVGEVASVDQLLVAIEVDQNLRKELEMQVVQAASEFLDLRLEITLMLTKDHRHLTHQH
jgi:hypothetical protein